MIPALRKGLRGLFPDAPAELGHRDRIRLFSAQAELAELSADDWRALRAWFVEADDEARGCKLWPRSRAEFLDHVGEAVEKVRRWWGGKRGQRMRRRLERRAESGGLQPKPETPPEAPSGDFLEFAAARGHNPGDVEAAWRDGRWQRDFAAWLMEECGEEPEH